MKRFNIKYLLILATIFILSCEKEYEIQNSATVNMAGEWWVELLYDADADGVITDADVVIYHYADFGDAGIVTTNTAANTTDSIWVIDVLGSWPFKAKFPIDYDNLTFDPASGLENVEVTGESITVHSGKILKGAATTLSGGVADSIFLALEFTDDPGSTYFYSGLRFSGHPEDHY